MPRISSSEMRIKLATRRATNGKGSELEFDLCPPPLSTPTDRDGGARQSVPAEGEPANGGDVARRTPVHEDSDSKMEDEEEAPEGATTSKSTITAYLEEMFFKKFDTIQSMVERLPGVAPLFGEAILTHYKKTAAY
ncbi:hypothetical protein Bca4012_006074 [Brassica carinata]